MRVAYQLHDVDHNVRVATAGLSVVLTVFKGNPDMFVSLADTHPNATNYQWRSRDVEGDRVRREQRQARGGEGGTVLARLGGAG